MGLHAFACLCACQPCMCVPYAQRMRMRLQSVHRMHESESPPKCRPTARAAARAKAPTAAPSSRPSSRGIDPILTIRTITHAGADPRVCAGARARALPPPRAVLGAHAAEGAPHSASQHASSAACALSCPTHTRTTSCRRGEWLERRDRKPRLTRWLGRTGFQGTLQCSGDSAFCTHASGALRCRYT